MKDITTLKAALKILKKGHKKCKTFNIKCGACLDTLLIDLLDDDIKLRQWGIKYNKKK